MHDASRENYWRSRYDAAVKDLEVERRRREVAEALAASLQAELDTYVAQARAIVEAQRAEAERLRARPAYDEDANAQAPVLDECADQLEAVLAAGG
jgi:hypothetical protein